MSNEKKIIGKNVNTGTNYGHIGDKFEGIQQRAFTEENFVDLQSQINDFIDKYRSRINPSHLTIGNPGDKESTIYCQQIYDTLVKKGYSVKIITLATFGYVDKNYSVSNAPDDTILIEVFQAPNV